jgi:pyruvate dehydrogenase E1 component beta subunit
MPIDILMPALSPTMEEGKLSPNGSRTEGDKVVSGDVIAEIETDKATMEVEAVDEGVVGKIMVPEGTENVKVNAVIAVLLEDGESASTSARRKPPSLHLHAAAAAPAAEPAAAASVPAAPVSNVAERSRHPRRHRNGATTVREALRDAMAEEMRASEMSSSWARKSPNIRAPTRSPRACSQEFGDKRVVDTPITEHGFAGIGVGAAMAGLRPIVEFMTFNFAMQAIDHIINSAAKTLYMSGGQMGAPIVFRGPNGAAARVGAQHSQAMPPGTAMFRASRW